MGRGRARFQRAQRRERRQADIVVMPPPKATITLKTPGKDTIILRVKDFKLDMDRDYVDVTSFDATTSEYVVGLRKYTITATE